MAYAARCTTQLYVSLQPRLCDVLEAGLEDAARTRALSPTAQAWLAQMRAFRECAAGR